MDFMCSYFLLVLFLSGRFSAIGKSTVLFQGSFQTVKQDKHNQEMLRGDISGRKLNYMGYVETIF